MNISEIIAEADLLVPNIVPIGDKVSQLNAINNDFFNVVKIPKLARFTGMVGQIEYILAPDVRQKNIDLVELGLLKYMDLQTDNVNPTQITYSFDDETSKLNLSPSPYRNALPGVVRYHRIGTTTFLVNNLASVPDAPGEYHWTFVPALAAWLASTQDDSAKAAAYTGQYITAWNVAAQNYQKG